MTQYELAAAGGITTPLILLVGSANAISKYLFGLSCSRFASLNSFTGGETHATEPRQTKKRSLTTLLVEPLFGLNASDIDYGVPPRWRHPRYACGMYNLPRVALLIDQFHP